MAIPVSSSTSNSKIAATSLVWAVLGLGLYGSVVLTGRVPYGTGINQDQKNYITQQHYLMDKTSPFDLVLAGSSMAAKVKVQYLDNRAYNLGVPGGSPQTGLQIILKAQRVPKVVVCELSPTLHLGPDNVVLARLLDPTGYAVSERFPFLRQEFQPTNVLLSKLKKKSLDDEGTVTSSATKIAIADAVQMNKDEPKPEDKAKFATHLRETRELLRQIKERGSRVVLLELPVAAEVDATRRMRYYHGEIVREFPVSDYEWLLPLAGEEVQTTDGIHLVPAQAAKVARALVALLPAK
ncbi:MAG: hypothetical protein K8R88_14045 [Armatimonadetes bacterium]|nr:hypothetical protein [Armatimonadota bacterium]